MKSQSLDAVLSVASGVKTLKGSQIARSLLMSIQTHCVIVTYFTVKYSVTNALKGLSRICQVKQIKQVGFKKKEVI